MKAVTAGWNVSSVNGKAHYVETHNGILNPMAACGRKSKKWYEAHEGDDKCLQCVSSTRPFSSGVRVHAGDFPSDGAGIPKDAKEHRVNFLQVVGPIIPLCWIPVADVKAVCLLLASFRPTDSLPLSQAQVDTVIAHLNKYIDEAVERNNRPSTYVTTYTNNGKKEKK